jgi:aminoacrylate peracid reductase
MPKKIIVPANAAPPLAPYSPGARAGNHLYVSGMLAIDSKGGVVGVGDVKSQTRHVLESVRAVVEAAGGTMEDIVHNAIFIRDLADYAAMNSVYAEFFPSNPPARYCIRADLVKPEFLVEVSTVACIEGA